MSYRELRNFTEIMRSLGYPRLISVENFRKPNFELVADILYWMVKLYDPETTLSDRVEFENERVDFLTNIAALMASKARLKLNTKKLYASDGRAVQEMLKLANLLYKAITTALKSNDMDMIPPPIKVQDVKVARGLASEITQSGAKLYDLLANESAERAERSKSLRFLDQAGVATEGSREYAYIERSVRELIESTKQALEDSKKESEELEVDEKNLDSKIRKKQEELERTEKRLRSLDTVRPQFMDEVDKLEKELQYHYDIYIEKFRNLEYLERELEKYHKAEEERKQIQKKKLEDMRKSLYREEVELLRGTKAGREETDENENTNTKRLLGSGSAKASSNTNATQAVANAARATYGGNTTNTRRSPRAQGSMAARNDDDSSEELGSDDEVSDRRMEEDDSDEELSIASKDERNRSLKPNAMNTRPQGERVMTAANPRRTMDSEEFGDDDDDDGDDDDGDDDGSEGSDDQF